ncbi:MAG: DUF1080 domain-containing protein [Fimbriimonadaceae bacterium]|nr:DUF1080 domain-containing protein [Fimbriimonadaceae bacterium]
MRSGVWLATLVLTTTGMAVERPRDPWVFRSVLDQRARMVTLALSRNLWVAYDATNCGFYKAWEGDVNFQGAVYTAQHGPQPTSRGLTFEKDRPEREIWFFDNNGTTTPIKPRFRGYQYLGSGVELHYEMDLPGGRRARVSERPESLDPRLSSVGLVRTYFVEGLPRGTKLRLDLNSEYLAPNTLFAGDNLINNQMHLRNGSSTLAVRYGAPEDDMDFPSPTPAPVSQETSQAREPGIAMRLYWVNRNINRIPRLVAGQTPNISVVVPNLDLGNDFFADPHEKFLAIFTGFLKAPVAGRYQFRLSSDDGSRLSIRDERVVDNDGLHGTEARSGYLDLAVGEHPIEVEYFNNEADARLLLEWKKPGDADFSVIPTESLAAQSGEVRVTAPGEKRVLFGGERSRPGDREPLAGVHPSFTLRTIDVPGFEPRIGGMDFLPDGRLVVCTWDEVGGVYIVDRVRGLAEHPRVKRIAAGLAEPLGLKVVNGDIYVLQKQELTKLIDHDGDEVIDEYYALANGWGVTDNFHEFAFGLVHRGHSFYANLATAINPGGSSTQPQNPDRGRVVAIDDRDGSYRFIAAGLRTPNGIGIGYQNRIFISDNQGDWLPSSKILPLIEGAFYGNRSVDPEGTANLEDTPPVVWLPQNEIGNSPSQMTYINNGPYKGQMLHGDVTHGGLKRVFVEEVDGVLQGCVFRFTQGLMAGINRMDWGPDGALYVGGIGSTGNWAQEGKKWFGLQKLSYNFESTFEMLKVMPYQNGIGIELTEPLAENLGQDSSFYQVEQWKYVPTAQYGGPKVDSERLAVDSVTISHDRKKIFLEVANLKPGHVFYVRVMPSFISTLGHAIWSTEAWYTLNRMPERTHEVIPAPPAPINQLTAEEASEGFKLLFDGNSLSNFIGWHKDHVPAGWSAKDGILTFTPGVEGGDLMILGEYGDFELRLDWKVSPNGNSGIIYRASTDRNMAYETGPEMQILDDEGHADGGNPLTSAGSLYALIAPPARVAHPAGMWNSVRIVARGPVVEQYLNGNLTARYDITTMDFARRLAASKFRDWPGFAKNLKGYIVLQDHGDLVEFRNLRIRPLSGEW